MSKKPIQIFWLVSESDSRARSIASGLQRQNYESHFFSSVERIRGKLKKIRPRIVVFGLCDSDLPQFQKNILDLASVSELNGTYFVLFGAEKDKTKKSIAVANNYRDLISKDITTEEFLERLLVATCRKKGAPPWNGLQLGIQKKLTVRIPSRITWLDKDNIRIEAPFIVPIGSSVYLNGKLFDKFGLEPLRVVVKEHSRQNLSYRFSHAFVASWALSGDSDYKKHKMVEFAKERSVNNKLKVFLAVQNPSLRSRLMEFFKRQDCDVRAALSKSSILREPLFLSPDLFVIEDKLLEDEKLKNSLLQKFKKGMEPTKLCFFGTKETISQKFLSNIDPKFDRLVLNHEDEKLLKKLQGFLPARTVNYKRAYLGIGHGLSIIDVVMPAKVESIFPGGGILGLPAYVRPNSLMQMEWLESEKKNSSSFFFKTHAKVPKFAPDSKSRYFCRFSFVDFDKKAQKEFLKANAARLLSAWGVEELADTDSVKKPNPKVKAVKSTTIPASGASSKKGSAPKPKDSKPSTLASSPIVKDTGMAMGFVGGVVAAFAGLYFTVSYFTQDAPDGRAMFSRELEKRFDPNHKVEIKDTANSYPPSFEARFRNSEAGDFRRLEGDSQSIPNTIPSAESNVNSPEKSTNETAAESKSDSNNRKNTTERDQSENVSTESQKADSVPVPVPAPPIQDVQTEPFVQEEKPDVEPIVENEDSEETDAVIPIPVPRETGEVVPDQQNLLRALELDLDEDEEDRRRAVQEEQELIEAEGEVEAVLE